MRVTRLHIHKVRNLDEILLCPHPQFNLFLGNNGSGKTSILEAIHLLALGRSFRSRQVQTVISYTQPNLSCFGELIDEHGGVIPVGIEKNRQGEVKCKVSGELCPRLSQFATVLPVQLLTPDTFKLLLAGAEERRKFLDWGVFHVEHSFGALCQRYQRLLKQRNAALKARSSESAAVWENELAQVGEKLAQHRQSYLDSLLPYIERLFLELLGGELALRIDYEQGWDLQRTLAQAIEDALPKDQRWGYTSVGPHRAEISFKVKGAHASQVLSRGQQKLLICGLYLAQGEHLLESLGKRCLYLLDDLASELDSENRQKVVEILVRQNHQVFLTSADPKGWGSIWERVRGEMFHVEQGSVSKVTASQDLGLV